MSSRVIKLRQKPRTRSATIKDVAQREQERYDARRRATRMPPVLSVGDRIPCECSPIERWQHGRRLRRLAELRARRQQRCTR